MEVKLLNAKNGEQVEKAYTNIDGEYKFQNLQNGEYIVIFYYDNTRLGIAEYKMKNVADNQNSDVITTTEDGREVATTDIITIKDGSKSNIDAGFVDVLMFDLSLRKTITKVTVQDNSGTRSYDFDDTDLAKVDINGKYLNNAKVLIEYRNQVSDKKYTEIIDKAREFIKAQYKNDEMSLQTVASYVNVSSNHFSAIFRKETGETFIDYLTKVRMDNAKDLLTCTSMKTSEIGFEVGYKDPHYFSYIFKKTIGMSPKEYRRMKKDS